MCSWPCESPQASWVAESRVDGTSNDRFYGGQLFRLATMERVLAEFPSVVMLLAANGARVDEQNAAEGILQFQIYDRYTNRRYFLREPDYRGCLKVAKMLVGAAEFTPGVGIVVNSVSTFGPIRQNPAESESTTIGRIQAWLRVEFADRS